MNSIIKLTNGETIVAEIVHQDDKTTSVLEPLALEIGQSETGRPMMVAMTWVPLTKKINMVNLNTHHVVAVSECDDEISMYYERSLAVLKNDVEKLKKLVEEDSDDDHEEDPWTEKFGQPVEFKSANTVH